MANYDGHLKLKALRSCDRKSLQRLNARLLKLEIQIERDKAQLENSQAQLIEAKSKNRDLPTKLSDAKLNATGRDFCQIWCD